MSGRVFLGWTSAEQRIECLAQGHKAVPPARLEPVMLLIAYVKNNPSNRHIQLSRGARGIHFDRILHLYYYFVRSGIKSSGETA